MTNFVGLRGKTYIYLIDDGNKDKKTQKAQKNVLSKKKTKLNLKIKKSV